MEAKGDGFMKRKISEQHVAGSMEYTPGSSMRSLFPAFYERPDLVYLDSAATTLKPEILSASVQEIMGKKYGTVHRSIYQLAAQATEQFEYARLQMHQWLGGFSDSHVVFTKGTTDAINLIAHGLEAQFQPGDEIVVSSLEHHSNWVPWQRLCARKQLHFRILEIDPSKALHEQNLEPLSSRTKLIAITHMPNTTGLLLDWSDLIAQAKSLGAFVVMDGAQAMTCGSFDLASLGCDFYTFSLHKLYGPTGLGILWGRSEALEKLEPRDSGGEMVDEVGDTLTTYAPLPLRLEAGTPPIIEVLSLVPLLNWWKNFSRDELLSHKIKLAQRAREILSKYPQVQILSPHHQSSLVLFDVDNAHPMDVTTFLDLEGICVRSGHMCAQPALRRLEKSHAIRISFGLYNDFSDLDRFTWAFEQTLQRLQ